jgi:hypothetical protein
MWALTGALAFAAFNRAGQKEDHVEKVSKPARYCDRVLVADSFARTAPHCLNRDTNMFSVAFRAVTACNLMTTPASLSGIRRRLETLSCIRDRLPFVGCIA